MERRLSSPCLTAANLGATIPPMPATLDPALRQGIGASQVAALFGCHPYLTPLGLYCQVLGLEPPSDSPVMRRGTKLEGYIAEEYAARNGLWTGGVTGLVDLGTQRHPEHKLLIASPDRVVVLDGGEVVRLIEIKTARSRAGWSDPEEVEDGVPLHYSLQVQQQLLVGVEAGGRHQWPQEAHLVACVGSLDDLSIYTIRASAKVHAAIVERVERFWTDHVEPRVPPPWDGSEAGAALLKAMYTADRLPPVAAPPELEPIAAELRAAKADLAAAEARVDTAQQILKASVADAAGMQGSAWRCSWKRNRPSHPVDWEAVAREAGASETLIQKHTAERPGARVFRFTWSDDAAR